MSQYYSFVTKATIIFFAALMYLSCLVWWLLEKAVGGLTGVCADVVGPLVLDSFAWEALGNIFECLRGTIFEAGPFSNTPEAAPVGNTGTTYLREECAWQVRPACTSTFSLAVSSRSHYCEASHSGSESREFAPREPSLVVAASSASQVSVITNIDEAPVDVEVAQAAEADQVAENHWPIYQVDPSYVDRMEVDPWWWKGVVTFEYTPEMMDIDVPVEGGLDGADLDQPMQVDGDVDMQENSDIVACEDILMEDAFPQETAEPMVQDHMELQAHSDRGVESDAYVADIIMTQAPPLERVQSVVTTAPETREEGDVVLNRGSSVNLPTLPSTEVLNQSNTVLEQAPVQNQGISEGRSGAAGSSRSVEQHPAGCQCATCATVARELEELRAFFHQFEEEEEDEEEQEEAQEQMHAARNRTNRRSRLLGRR